MVSHFNSHLFDETRTSMQLLHPRFGPKTCFVIKESNLAEGAKVNIMRREKWKKKILIVQYCITILAAHYLLIKAPFDEIMLAFKGK